MLAKHTDTRAHILAFHDMMFREFAQHVSVTWKVQKIVVENSLPVQSLVLECSFLGRIMTKCWLDRRLKQRSLRWKLMISLKLYSIQYPKRSFLKSMGFLLPDHMGEHGGLDLIVRNYIPLEAKENEKWHSTISGKDGSYHQHTLTTGSYFGTLFLLMS